MDRRSRLGLRFFAVFGLVTLIGCAQPPEPSRAVASNPAAGQAQVPAGNGQAGMATKVEHAPSDSLPIGAFRGMIEAVAKEIASAPAYQDASNAPTIALGDFHNATPLKVDRAMALESIRAQTILASGGKVRFRDDEAYGAIVEERARQSATAASVDRSGWRPTTSSHFEQKTTVDGRVSEARVILSGSVFQLHDRDTARPDWGVTYHQFHFRLIDVRTGLILWEKVVGIATEGAIVVAKDMTAGAGDRTDGRRRTGGFTGRLVR